MGFAFDKIFIMPEGITYCLSLMQSKTILPMSLIVPWLVLGPCCTYQGHTPESLKYRLYSERYKLNRPLLTPKSLQPSSC